MVRDKRAEAAALGADLAVELQSVTLQEFRLTEARYETDAQLGRELLFLLSNAEWSRRTTEVLDISRASAVDTKVTVDVDPGFITHEALRSVRGPLRLPLFTLPSEIADDGRSGGAEPPIGVEIVDATGTRIAGVPQAEVRRQLAAVLAEMLVIRLDRMPTAERTSRYGRDHDVLLAAALNQLLVRAPAPAAPPVPVRERWFGRAEEAEVPVGPDEPADLRRPGTPLEYARTDLRFLLEDEPPPDDVSPRNWVLTSWEADVVRALRGSTFVVVPVEATEPTSFTLTMPSRALERRPRTRWRGTPAVRVRAALLAPTTHADRVTEVLLPDGVQLRRTDRAAVEVIDVAVPQQFDQLRRLVDRVLDPAAAPWPRKQLAEFAATKLESVLQCLRHHYDAYVPGADEPDRTLRADLRTLRRPLQRLATGPVDPRTGDAPTQPAATADLAAGWAPLADRLAGTTLRRRVERSVTSPGSVRFRAPAIEDFTLRAQPTGAYLEVDLEAGDSLVLGTARAVNLVNLAILGLVFGLLLWRPFGAEVAADAQVLATLLTFFPAIQASRLSQPDSTRLVGLLTLRHYLAGLATVLPGLALAGALAFGQVGDDDVVVAGLTFGPDDDGMAVVAGICLAAQFACAMWIRDLRDPERWFGLPARLRPRSRRPVTLRTTRSPDHLRFDVLRSAWCRTLTGDVLLAGRLSHPYVVVDDGTADALVRLLAGSQGTVRELPARELPAATRGRELLRRAAPEMLRVLGSAVATEVELRPAGPRPATPNLVGVLRGTAAGLAGTFLVFRDEPDEDWAGSGETAGRTVVPLDLAPGQLAPMEPPDWVLDVMVGFDPGLGDAPVQEHPLATIAYAADWADFTVLNVQLPAPPLEDDRPRRWLRARVGVPLRRNDPLDRLAVFLDRLHGLRRHGMRVHLREVPPTESLDATQAAREDPFDAPPGLLGAGRAEKTGDLVTVDDVLVPAYGPLRRLAVCAPPHSGLLAGVLSALALSDQVSALDAAVSGVLNGTAVVFLTCRAGGGGTGALEEIVPAYPKLRGHGVTVTELRMPRPAPTPAIQSDRPAEPAALLQVRVYTPDRPGVLQGLAAALGRELAREAAGRPDGRDAPLDVLYGFIPVVDGQSISGRMLVRLPVHRHGNAGWEAAGWPAVRRRVEQAVSAAAGAGRAGDTVIGLDLVRRPRWLRARPAD